MLRRNRKARYPLLYQKPILHLQHSFGITLLSGLFGMDRTAYMSFNKTKITYMVATIGASWERSQLMKIKNKRTKNSFIVFIERSRNEESK